MNGWTAQDMPDQSGRVAVITGANSGLGYQSALELARKGARVVMACRNAGKGEQARHELLSRVPGADAVVMPLDLASLRSVREFAAAFDREYQRLDILMNNAGLMLPPYQKTADGFEIQFGTNHLGHFALTGLLLPRLLGTASSRVVTISSSAYELNARIHFDDLQSEKRYGRWAAYSQSKLANVLFMLELQRRLEAAGADTISAACHPGYTVTNLQKRSAGFFNYWLIRSYEPFVSMPVETGVRYQLYAATAPDVRGGEFFGPRYFMKGDIVRLRVNARGRDAAVAARLWEVSEGLTGVRYEALGRMA